ncbi:MAG: Holliday junction branch migration protein RuvA, partial [Mangrovicoccus sp.]|nr:Holliday junction branch migration protein RuvA [Mangrovicoccus sp.]
IDVGGVGYIVYCSDRTLAALPVAGGWVSLYTDLVVREDLLQLFGFQSMVEKEWYRLLTSVQGVGARVALAILGRLGPEGVGRAIALGDAATVRAAPGVGPKLAARVVNELRDKAPGVMAMSGLDVPLVMADPAEAGAPVAPARRTRRAAPAAPAIPQAANPTGQADALSALVNLGYGASEAAAAVVRAATETPDAPAQVLIRAALRSLAPKE